MASAGLLLLAKKMQPVLEAENGSYYAWLSTEFPILSEAKLGGGLLILRPSGFALPHYADSSKIGYVTQGSGKAGVILRGSSEEKVIKLHKGDMIPIPLGSTSWWFNNKKSGDFSVLFLGETSKANSPGNITYFFFAGALGIFNGFSAEFQKRAVGLSEEETTKITKSQTGALIIKVEDQDMPKPSNCVDHMVYNTEAAEPNAYVKNGGILVTVTSEELSVLEGVALSGAIVKLHENAMYAPNFSSDSAFQVYYVSQGSGRVQIVGLNGQNVLDETVKAGELFVVPEFFVVSVIAEGEGMEWFSIFTMEKPVVGQLVGKTSIYNVLSPIIVQAALNITPELEKQFRSKMKATEIFFSGGK